MHRFIKQSVAPVFVLIILIGNVSLFAQKSPLRVTAASPSRADVTRSIRRFADVVPFEDVVMRAKVTGFVETVLVDRGDRVKAGQELVRLHVPEHAARAKVLANQKVAAQAAVAIARAKVAEAAGDVRGAGARQDASRSKLSAGKAEIRYREKDLKRLQRLLKDGSTTPQRVDEASADHEKASAVLEELEAEVVVAETGRMQAEQRRLRAESEVALAEAKVGIVDAEIAEQRIVEAYSVIRAPFDGVVTKRMIHTGGLVLGGSNNSNPTDLVHVIRVDKVRVTVPIPETEIPFARVGMDVSITGPGIRGDAIQAKVTSIAGALTGSSRQLLCEIIADDDRLLSGMGVYVDIGLETHKKVLTVPGSAVRTERRKPFLWVIDGGVAKKLPVSLGISDLIGTEVRGAGLTANTKVILSASGTISSDRPVVEGSSR